MATMYDDVQHRIESLEAKIAAVCEVVRALEHEGEQWDGKAATSARLTAAASVRLTAQRQVAERLRTALGMPASWSHHGHISRP